MGGMRFELWLATTAIALVAAGVSLPVQSAPLTEDEISAAVPMPEPANLPPPTVSDIAPRPSTDQPAATPGQAASPAPARDSTQPAAAPTVATPQTAPPETAPPAVATPPAVAPAEAPVLTIDQRVGEKLREMFGGRSDRIIDRKAKAPVEAFYAARNHAPIWVDNGAANARGKAAATYLAGVSADGLDPNDYPVPSFANADAGALAESELKFTATVLTYARHAQIGRVHYSRVSADIVYDLVAPEPGAVLAKLADAKDTAAALDSFNPPHAGYKALKAKLAEARGRTGEPGRVRISSGKTLKPGMEDPRVPLLRQRLGVAGDSANTTYDKALSEAVKTFQGQRDLASTGVLNNATVDALNGPRRDRDADVIIANMERWRWLPCEPACRRGRVEKEPVAICRLKRVAADFKDDIRARLPRPAARNNGKRVALVGGGPASLTVARDLTPLGYTCVVFDGDPKAGGMMRTQIPKFRLPDSVIDEECDYVLGLGIEFRGGQRI